MKNVFNFLFIVLVLSFSSKSFTQSIFNDPNQKNCDEISNSENFISLDASNFCFTITLNFSDLKDFHCDLNVAMSINLETIYLPLGLDDFFREDENSSFLSAQLCVDLCESFESINFATDIMELGLVCETEHGYENIDVLDLDVQNMIPLIDNNVADLYASFALCHYECPEFDGLGILGNRHSEISNNLKEYRIINSIGCKVICIDRDNIEDVFLDLAEIPIPSGVYFIQWVENGRLEIKTIFRK